MEQEETQDDRKPVWHIVTALCIVVIVAIAGVAYLGKTQWNRPGERFYLGGETLRGIATGTPQVYDELTDENIVRFTLPDLGGLEGMARVPERCGESIARGTEITVRFTRYHAYKGIVGEPPTFGGGDVLGVILCKEQVTFQR